MTTTAERIHRSILPAPANEPSVAVATLRHAAADPSAVAVVDGATGETITRGDLAARSAAGAAGVRARGGGRGGLVAGAVAHPAGWPGVARRVRPAGRGDRAPRPVLDPRR